MHKKSDYTEKLQMLISDVISDINTREEFFNYINKLNQPIYKPENWDKLFSIINKKFIRTGKIERAKLLLQLLLKSIKHWQLEAEVKLALADIAIRTCNWDEGMKMLSAGKLIFQQNSDPTGQAKVENLWGIYHGERGDISLAKNHFTAGLSLLGTNTNPEMIAELEANIAISEIICYNFVSAESHLKNALKTFNESGDNRWLAEMIYNYGMLHLYNKNYQQAIDDFDGAIDVAEGEDHLQILTLAKGAKALALIYSSKIEEGLILAEESLTAAKKIDDKLTVADNHKIIGIGERAKENYKKAEEELTKSYDSNLELNNNLNAAECAFEMAVLFAQKRLREKSYNWYKISIDYFESIGAKNRINAMEETMKTIEL